MPSRGNREAPCGPPRAAMPRAPDRPPPAARLGLRDRGCSWCGPVIGGFGGGVGLGELGQVRVVFGECTVIGGRRGRLRPFWAPAGRDLGDLGRRLLRWCLFVADELVVAVEAERREQRPLQGVAQVLEGAR